MTNDIVALIDYYEREKEIDREKVVESLQYAFISAYRKNVPGSEKIEELRADIDPKEGDITMLAKLTVVADDDHVDQWNEVPLALARKLQPDAEIDGSVEMNVTP